MLKRLENLVVLQEKDRSIAKLQTQIDLIPEQKAAIQNQWQKAESDVLASQDKIKRLQIDINTVELDVKTRQDSIQKLKVQQFETKKNDEYTKLGEDVIRYEQEVNKLEDKELELLEQLEQLNAELATNTKIKTTQQSLIQQEVTQLVASVKNIKAQLAAQQAERDAQAQKIDPADLEIYSLLLKGKKGNAVVGIQSNNSCSGCHIKVNSGVINNLKKDDDLVYCDNCGCIVYLYHDYGIAEDA